MEYLTFLFIFLSNGSEYLYRAYRENTVAFTMVGILIALTVVLLLFFLSRTNYADREEGSQEKALHKKRVDEQAAEAETWKGRTVIIVSQFDENDKFFHIDEVVVEEGLVVLCSAATRHQIRFALPFEQDEGIFVAFGDEVGHGMSQADIGTLDFLSKQAALKNSSVDRLPDLFPISSLDASKRVKFSFQNK